MGDKAKRVARFKAEHPVCYFCATTPTETIDHAPSRECFRKRIGPEGYEFPACRRCNHGSSQIEQAIALYLHGGDNLPIDSEQLRRLERGVWNNNRELMPIFEKNARSARNLYKSTGRKLRPGQTYGDMTLFTLPDAHKVAFDIFSKRLTCALYYKEIGRPVSLNHSIACSWIAWDHPDVENVMSGTNELFPFHTKTNRRNTNIGDQFSYDWTYDAGVDTFGFNARFSQSMYVVGAAAPTELCPRNDNWECHRLDVPWLNA